MRITYAIFNQEGIAHKNKGGSYRIHVKSMKDRSSFNILNSIISVFTPSWDWSPRCFSTDKRLKSPILAGGKGSMVLS